MTSGLPKSNVYLNAYSYHQLKIETVINKNDDKFPSVTKVQKYAALSLFFPSQ